MARRAKATKRGSEKQKQGNGVRQSDAPPAVAAVLARPGEAEDGDQPKPPDKKALGKNKIFPRNLTAQAAYLVPGNPVVTRPEDTVANCFPGLEIDVRNLDRRFFPGLVFEFISDGAKLAYVDLYLDPDLQLPEAAKLAKTLSEKYDSVGGDLTEGDWFLDWVEQKGKRFSLHGRQDTEAWRIVRSLEQGPVRISLKKKKAKKKEAEKRVTLSGWRRRFTDEKTGVISAAYQPGELMQGLCSPWQHDFRDCSCFYWAANHPDVVLGEVYPGEPVPPSEDSISQVVLEAPNAPRPSEELDDPNFPLDWLRSDRARAREAEAFETIEKNRPHQLDHFQVNQVWQELNIVLENREIGSLYVAEDMDNANPYKSPLELAEALSGKLGRLEIALTFEYLFARSSLLGPDEAARVTDVLPGVVELARENLMLIAASEMQHLRWVNQLLWGLYQSGKIPKDSPIPTFVPVLTPATEVPTSTLTTLSFQVPESAPDRKQRLVNLVGEFIESERKTSMSKASAAVLAVRGLRPRTEPGLNAFRPASLRPLTPAVLDDFVAVEHPSAYIDGAYARVVATLRNSEYPEHMVGVAMRIASDGLQHEKRFREVKSALSIFFRDGEPSDPNQVYLRQGFHVGTQREAQRAVAPLQRIKRGLREAYIAASGNELGRSGEGIADARRAMTELFQISEELAERRIGIPYFDLWNAIP